MSHDGHDRYGRLRSLSSSRHVHRYGFLSRPKLPSRHRENDDLPVIIRTEKKLYGEEVLRIEQSRDGLSSEKNQSESDSHLINRGIL